MIFWTNHHNIEQKIWFFEEIVGHGWSKTEFWLIFYKLPMELLQVDMGNYHLKIHFHVVRYQMSHCYLCCKSKTNMKKWYIEYFIADNFPALNKKDPVYLNRNYIWKKNRQLVRMINIQYNRYIIKYVCISSCVLLDCGSSCHSLASGWLFFL